MFSLEKGHLTYTELDPVNPHYLALQNYQSRGYNLEFRSEDETSVTQDESVEVFCHDPIQNINLDHRLELLGRLPDQNFLMKVYHPYD
jgi:hypothetical protein